jgi:NAD(P)-dependent dehydrogenase (short-subunit alcohol dehydrogenase family)
MSRLRSILLYGIPFVVIIVAVILGAPHRDLDWNGTIVPMAEKSNLNGTHVLITGATSGIGESLTMALLKLGATVNALGRSHTKLERLRLDCETELRPLGLWKEDAIRTFTVDLADLAAVGKVGKEMADSLESLDILINNAGMHGLDNMFAVDAAVGTDPPYDRVFVVNYLSHVLLTELLLPLLKKSGKSPRIVQTTSSYHWAVDGSDLLPMDGAMPVAAQPGGSLGYYVFRTQRSYANSKLAQILHARALAANDDAVKAVSFCPGWVATHIAGADDVFATRMLNLLAFPVQGWGIASALHAVLDHQHSDGDYYINSHVVRLAEVLFPRPTPGWMYAYALRDAVTNVFAYLALALQRLGAHACPMRSSPESYNATLAQELHQWSLQALQPYL